MFRVITSLLLNLGLTVQLVMSATIPPDIKKCVTFIYRPEQGQNFVPNGTGFFVAVQNENNPEINNVYLVTAKHVLERASDQWYSSIAIRLNNVNNGSALTAINLAGDHAFPVYTHPSDKTVDLAVLPLLPDQTKFDFKVLGSDQFVLATKESFDELHLGEGSDVFFTGLFVNYIGEQRNQPIVRFGHVALISDEKIAWSDETHPTPQMLELYLIESQSYGGNSGSPVFFSLGADRTPGSIVIGPPVIKLAGVMKGSFNTASRIVIAQQNDTVPVALQNVGIAAVVPSHLLGDILFSDQLKEQRARANKAANAK
jgi:hypothetical protein